MMKKITLLFLMLTAVGFSQTFDFNNSDSGWTKANGLNSVLGANTITYTTVDGDGAKKNPSFGTETAGVDANTIVYAGITMKNSSANGPLYMRISYPKNLDPVDPTKRVYKNIDITNGDTEFKTYWIDVTNATHWLGTMNDIQVHFKNTGNTDYILPNSPDNAVIEVDNIEFVVTIPTTENNTFNFGTDNDAQGFTATNGSISGPTSGILTFIPAAAKFAKLEQTTFHINATANKYAHITLKNNSAANNQLRLVAAGLNGTQTQEITTSDAAEKTYTFDLSAEAGWTGDQTFAIGIGSLADGKAVDDGTVEISSVVFDNTASVNDTLTDVSFSVYPNPAKNFIKVQSNLTLQKIQLFNLLGKKVLESNLKDTNLNISKLNSGVYLLRVFDTNNNSKTQKLIIQ